MRTPATDARNRSVIRRAQPQLEEILLLSLPTPIGRMQLAASATGLVRIQLPAPDTDQRIDLWLGLHFPRATRRRGVNPVLRKGAQQIEAYFTGNLRSFSLSVELAGTPFQLAVWKLVADIPFGSTRSYGAIARTLGNPNAVRAVGAAQGANPVPIVVPCHRVLGSDGALIGYGGGLPTKRWLLEHERERLGRATESSSPQLSLFSQRNARLWSRATVRPARNRSRP